MVNEKIGLDYVELVCDECRTRVIAETAKLSKFDLLRPKKLARRFQMLVCGECRIKIIRRMKKRQQPTRGGLP